MTLLKALFLILGLVLLGLLVRDMDSAEILRHIRQVGSTGIGFVIALYAVTFLADVAGWHLTFKTIPLNLRWLQRLYVVRMTGEAFNNVTPLGAMGGEPVKAMLLKSRYGVNYRESGASLILAKTAILIALVFFLALGFLVLMPSEHIQSSYKAVAGIGLAGFATAITLFFLVQRFRLSSWLGRLAGGSALGHRLETALRVIHEVDERLASFYTERRARFAGALALAFINWLLGVVEVYALMQFLGYPVSFMDAWIIEAMAQLVRAGTSFIPASVGAQEGAIILACSAITGDPTLGFALSVIRRVREIVWIIGGLGLWLLDSIGETNTRIERDSIPEAPVP
ncbi:MAG: flippase-like domain-containing protein [Gammaproteobacteria bacterium]